MRVARVVTALVPLAILGACPGRGSSDAQAPRHSLHVRPAAARWTLESAIAHRVLVLPSGELLVLGQRRPSARRDAAHDSVAFVAVFDPGGALRWEHVHADAWELAERASVRADGTIAVQGRSAAPDRDDRTWVLVLAQDGTLRASVQAFAAPRPIGIGWAGNAVEILGIARDASSMTVARLQVGGSKIATVEHDLAWGDAATLAAVGEARRSGADRWYVWTDESTAHAIRLENDSGVVWVRRDDEESDDRDGPVIEGALPRLGPAVAVLDRGGGFVVRPRVPTADADAHVEIAWSADPEAESTRLQSQTPGTIVLPEPTGDDAAHSFAVWRWHGLAADEDGWDDALARQPVAARALVRALVRAGVCEPFAGEGSCNENDVYLGPPGFLTDVDDACRRREYLDTGLPALVREDVEALHEHWSELLTQLEVPGDPDSTTRRERILDHIRTVGAAVPIARAFLDDVDDTAREGFALLTADGSPAALDALADIEDALWKDASRCTLARLAREALAAAGRKPPTRTVDRRDACELVFALCVLDDDALWAAALPDRARTIMTCSPDYPVDLVGSTIDEPCEAGTTRGVEPFEMTSRAAATCSGTRAELDEPYDPAGNCGVSESFDQRTIELAADRKGRHYIRRMMVARSVEGP